MNTVAIQSGAVIDGFVLGDCIYRGSMATVWRVAHPDWSLPLVMKIPQTGYGEDPAAIVGFEVEQMVMPTLRGPHVPRFIAARDFGEQPYIVMEFITGISLRTRFDVAPLPLEEVVSAGIAVAAALHALHRQHVVHLDIKPSSVVFRENGIAVLIDYGLAHHNHMPDLLAEEFRLPLGTGPYISPEQVLGVRNDPRSDLFALGVVLYQLLTGERPFGNPSSLSGLRQRLYRDPVPPRALPVNCPPWLQEVILRCLEVDASRRYGTAAQLAFDLAHPDQIALTERSRRTERAGRVAVARRWFRAIGAEPAPAPPAVAHLAAAPIIMAAIDLSPQMQALAQEVRSTVRRIMASTVGARLACVTVLRTARVGMDEETDSEGRSLHVQALVELKHWAQPLGLDADRVTHHVLHGTDLAHALVEYAQVNDVDHIVLGARGSSALRRYLGSVSSHVVAEAPCTVTVVRLPESRAE